MKKAIFIWILLCIIQSGLLFAQTIDGYSEKVIIKGKWGTAPGEFGYRVWEGEADYPKSFVIDSDDNIYILDKYNNRIQKYDIDGKFMEIINVESFRLSTAEEIAHSKNSWNTLGNPFPSVSIDEITSVDNEVYLFKRKLSDYKFKEEIQNVKDNKVTAIADENKIKYVKGHKNIHQRSDYIKSILRNTKKYSIKKAGSEDTNFYGGKEINKAYKDLKNNLYIYGYDGHLKIYDNKEDLINDLNLRKKLIPSTLKVKENGDIYFLKIFSEEYPEREGIDLSIDQYSGIELIKLEKNAN